MSKTISQIAQEIGVSRQSVWYKTKNKQFAKQIKKYSKIIGKTLYIDENGEKIIKNAFAETSTGKQQNLQHENRNEIVNIDKTVNDNATQENNYNQQMIDILNLQLTNANKQNEELKQDYKELKQDYKTLTQNYNKLVEESHTEKKLLLELTDKLTELTANAQKLHAGDIVVPKLETAIETDKQTKKSNIFNIFFKNKNKTTSS